MSPVAFLNRTTVLLSGFGLGYLLALLKRMDALDCLELVMCYMVYILRLWRSLVFIQFSRRSMPCSFVISGDHPSSFLAFCVSA